MNVARARTWLVKVSLVAIAVLTVFLLLAPPIGYPLRSDQSLRLLESVVPTFLGLLGSATIFLVDTAETNDVAVAASKKQLLELLTRGPIAVFSVIVLGAFIAFWSSNRATSSSGSGMSVNDLAHAISFANGLLVLTTNAVGAFLFRTDRRS